MTKELTIARPAADLLQNMDTQTIARTASALVRFAPGGRVLNNTQASQLAVYALMTDLNPFNLECYWMDRVGPTAGVAGYRRKAKEYNRIHGGGEYYVEYRPAEDNEANFETENGDVAWVAIITDDASINQWESTLKEWMRICLDSGMDADSAWKRANLVAGTRPRWEAAGVVAGSEKFAAEGRAEIWDRNERAKKRAEKGALRKRYPDVLNIPEYSEATSVDEQVSVIVRDVVKAVEERKENFDPEQALLELGFVPAEEKEDEDIQSAPKDDVYQAVVDAGLSDNKHAAMNALSKYCKTGFADAETAIAWMRVYRGKRDEGLEPKDAAAFANK